MPLKFGKQIIIELLRMNLFMNDWKLFEKVLHKKYIFNNEKIRINAQLIQYFMLMLGHGTDYK